MDEDQKQQEIQKLYESVECNIQLQGCTGIEDKLQEDVPRTIQRLIEADIKVIMQTGDKLETAVNIGYLANLINKDTKLFKIK